MKVNINGEVKYTPCNEYDNQPGIEYRSGTMLELPPNSLALPNVNIQHFKQALQKSKPSVNQADIHNYIEWTKSFGQDG